MKQEANDGASRPAGSLPLRSALWFFLTIAAAVAADQAIKAAVEAVLPFQEGVPLLPFLALFRTYNEGIAFSMLAGAGDTVLIGLTLAIIAGVLLLWRSTPAERRLTHFGYALILAGALGNLIDRVRLGHVIDYVLFHTPAWSFAVFNLADAFISLGAAAILLDELVVRPRSQRRGPAKDD